MANNNNNNSDGDKIEEWNTLVNQIASIVAFNPPDWTSDEGKLTRTKLEVLLADAIDYSKRHATIAQLEFDQVIQTEVDKVKAIWNIIDANAVAPLSDTIAVTQQPNTVQVVGSASASASGSRSVRGGMRKRKGEHPEDNSNPSSSRRQPPPQQVPMAASQPLLGNGSRKRVHKGEDPEDDSNPSSSRWPPPPRQAPIAASQPLPGNSSRKRVRKARPSLQIRHKQHSEGDLAAVTSVDEDITMIEASVRRQHLSPPPAPPPPPPSKIRVSRSCDPFTPDPLDAIRHLSIAPEQSQPTPPPTYPKMFEEPLDREDLARRVKKADAEIEKQNDVLSKCLQTFLAETQKMGRITENREFLRKIEIYHEFYDK